MDKQQEVPSMDCTDMINDMIDTLEPELVPSDFIVCAQLSMNDGSEIMVNGSEMAEALRLRRSNLVKYKVVLNSKLIHDRINIQTAFILAAVFG
jgi:hypothetical protein